MKVRLSRVASSHSNLRTQTVEGTADRWPAVGERFAMVAPPLDPAASVRLISTSPVKRLLEGGFFETENTMYLLEVLP